LTHHHAVGVVARRTRRVCPRLYEGVRADGRSRFTGPTHVGDIRGTWSRIPAATIRPCDDWDSKLDL